MGMLQPNQEFYKNTTNYQRIDSILAVALFCIVCALYALVAILEDMYPIIKENAILAGAILNIVMIVITIVFIKVRNKRLSSIGLYHGKWKVSCLIGIILATILFITNCLSNVINGASFVEGNKIIQFILYYFTVSLSEEIVFRGYIQTRLYGFIKNQYFVIIISGILFMVMHFPYRMIAYGMTISDLTIYNVGWILDLFITHTVLSLLYLKTNSLYGSIITHWMSSLAYNLIAR